MPGVERLDGGTPEVRPLADQAPVSQGYDEPFEDRVDDAMRRSGMRLTRAQAEAHVRDVDAYIDRVTQHLAELRAERGEVVVNKREE